MKLYFELKRGKSLSLNLYGQCIINRLVLIKDISLTFQYLDVRSRVLHAANKVIFKSILLVNYQTKPFCCHLIIQECALGRIYYHN